MHFRDGVTTAVTHAGAHTSGNLEQNRVDAALERDAPFDAFRNQLVDIGRIVLEITIGGAVFHRAYRAHATVRFILAALIQEYVARRFFRAGEHAAHHHATGACRQRLGDIARITDAAVADQRHAGSFQPFCHVGDRGDLRHAHAGDDPGGTDRTGANTDLDGVCTVFDQGTGRIGGGDIAADHVDVRELLLDPAHALQHAEAVAVGGVDHDDVHAGLHQQFDAFDIVGAYADCSAHAQFAVAVLTGIRVLGGFQDVLDGNQAAQFECAVDHQDPFQPMQVHQRLGLGQRRAFGHGDQALARRHDGAYRLIETLLETQVAIGHDTDQLAAFDHRETRNAMLARQFDDLRHRKIGRNGNRIEQNP